MYLVWIEPSGVINRIEFERGVNPEEGLQVDGLYVKYINLEPDGISMDQFIELKYYNFETDTFRARPARPNEVAEWNSETLEWEWEEEQLLNLIRYDRNVKISITDWAVLPDTSLTEAQVSEIRAYRQALRDMPATIDMSQITNTNDVTWPAPPSFIA